jgi:ammonia channel protein AmtB
MLNYSLINLNTAVEVNDDFTIIWILLSGTLVFFMQAEFTLVESGFTLSKNAVNISMKNILDISVGTLSYWVIGFGILKKTIGLRVTEEVEIRGLDEAEHGIGGFEAWVKENTK